MSGDVLTDLEATWAGCGHGSSRYIRVPDQPTVYDLVCAGCGGDLGRWEFNEGDEWPTKSR